MVVDRPHDLIVPEAEERAWNSARKCRVSVDIDQSVIGRNAFQMRWILDRHEPLRHRVVGLTDAADISVGPRLYCYPFNSVVEVALLDLVKETIFAFGSAGASHVHVHERIAMVDIPADRSRLAPQINRIRRCVVVVEAIGRCYEEQRGTPTAFREERG